MRNFWILLVPAALALLVGASLLAAAASPSGEDVGFTIPPGNYCAYITFDTVTGGTATITFSASPGAVDQFVMTADQHAAFLAGTGTSYLASASGASGSYSASLPSGGTYYIETCHASGNSGSVQSGTFTTFVQAVSAGPFYGGIAGVVVGVILAVLGVWLLRRPAPPAAPRYPAPYPVAAGVPYYAAAPWPPTPAAAAYGTISLSVQNTSALEESVAVLVNGVQAASFQVGAGQTASTTLHPALANPYGTVVRIEAVTSGGQRAVEDVTLTAHAGVALALKVG